MILKSCSDEYFGTHHGTMPYGTERRGNVEGHMKAMCSLCCPGVLLEGSNPDSEAVEVSVCGGECLKAL